MVLEECNGWRVEGGDDDFAFGTGKFLAHLGEDGSEAKRGSLAARSHVLHHPRLILLVHSEVERPISEGLSNSSSRGARQRLE